MSAADYVYDEELVDAILFGEKTCPTCGAKKPANTTYWHATRETEDGLTRECKVCRLPRDRRARHD